MIYDKRNYYLMAIAILTVILGFALMSGGGSQDPEIFNPEIFSSRRIVLAPIVCLLGFGLMIVAILLTSNKKKQN